MTLTAALVCDTQASVANTEILEPRLSMMAPDIASEGPIAAPHRARRKGNLSLPRGWHDYSVRTPWPRHEHQSLHLKKSSDADLWPNLQDDAIDARAHAMAKNMEIAAVSAERDRYAEEVRALEKHSKDEAHDHTSIVSALRLELRAQAKELVEQREQAQVARLQVQHAQESESRARRSLQNQERSMKEMQVSLMIVTQEKISLQEEKQRLSNVVSLKAEDEAPLKEKLRKKESLLEELSLKNERVATAHAIEVAQMAAQIQELQSQLNHAAAGLPRGPDSERGPDTQRTELLSSSEVPPTQDLSCDAFVGTSLTLLFFQATPRQATGDTFLAAAAMLEEGFTGTSDLDLDHDGGVEDALGNLQRASELVAASGPDGSDPLLSLASGNRDSLTRRLTKTTSERKRKHEAH